MTRLTVFVAPSLVLAICAQTAAQSGSAAASRPSPPVPAPLRAVAPAVLPGTPATAFATIHVTAVSATDAALPGRVLRVRDVQYGRTVATGTTDQAGTFTFRGVDPGSYLIELLGGNQSIDATSALLTVDAGAVVYTVVRLPGRRPVVGFFDGGVVRAAVITAAAAGAGVLAVQSTTDVSPR